jgi:hypothetical protein
MSRAETTAAPTQTCKEGAHCYSRAGKHASKQRRWWLKRRKQWQRYRCNTTSVTAPRGEAMAGQRTQGRLSHSSGCTMLQYASTALAGRQPDCQPQQASQEAHG